MSRCTELLKNSEPTGATRKLSVQLRPLAAAMSSNDIAKWDALERRSLLANPFLSSAFLFSQPEQRLRDCELHLLTVETEGRWLAAGLFQKKSRSRNLALPHLVALPMLHVYKTGMLIDAEHARSAVAAIWEHLRGSGLHGIKFPLFPLGSPLSFLLNDECDRQHLKPVTRDHFLRASVSTHERDPSSGVSPARLKSLARGRRILERYGNVQLEIKAGSRLDDEAVERFLFLEAAGWKGRANVALLSNSVEADSFRRLSSRLMQDDRLRFAELRTAQEVVASLCLFRSESDYYAFKIGWNPDYERCCPGFLLAHMLRSNIKNIEDCERIDGCARQGSFLDHVWESRKEIGTIIFPTTRWGSVAAQRSHEVSRGLQLVRSLKKKLSRNLFSAGGTDE